MKRKIVAVAALVLVAGGMAAFALLNRKPSEQALQYTCRQTARHAFDELLAKRMTQADGQAAVDRDCNADLDAITVQNILDPEGRAAVVRYANAHPSSK